MRSVLLWLFLAFAAPCLLAQRMPETSHAQQAQFSFATDREDLISLKGKWRFQPGDNPAYASPTFDDSHWALLDSDRPWSEQGYKGMSGLAWYRFRITLPAGTESMALYLEGIRTCYQVFADGTLIGTVGKMPPHPAMYEALPTVFLLPTRRTNESQTVIIALRVWHDPDWSAYVGGGPQFGSQLGSVDLIQDQNRKIHQALSWQHAADLILITIELIAGLIALALYLLRRSENEYVWFAVLSLTTASLYGLDFYTYIYTRNVHLMDMLNSAASALDSIASLLFYRSLFKGRLNLLFWFAIASVATLFAGTLLVNLHLLPVPVFNALQVPLALPGFIWVLLLLYKRVRDRLPDAKFLIFPLLISTVNGILQSLGIALDQLGLPPLPFSLVFVRFPVEIDYGDIAELLFLIAMLAILIARFARTSRNQDRVASEFEAARSLQHVLIPDELPTIPGLSIATAYHPAQEVGGDFFQVIPLPGGETLIVIGDVSGKGLKAAMNVSVIVGALRTLAEITTSPALILAGLNRRLQSRDAGFTTCIVLRFAADNTLTFSNAGHLAPYVNGRELETEANLPLGLLESCCYQEQSIPLNPGDHLTVLTDGIPEATRRIAKKDELFGFTRTQEIAHQTAASIAKAALTFGQTDDITVLTIDLLPSV